MVWTKDQQRASEKKYRLNNPEKIKEKYKKQSQNINRRIRDAMNKRITSSLKAQKTYKNNLTSNYIGCSIEFLRKWLQYQFKDNMNWNNYGDWHIDHVKPCSVFNLNNINELKICFHWSNLQPLWGIENCIKSNKVDINYIKLHNHKAIIYELNSFFSAQVKESELLEHP